MTEATKSSKKRLYRCSPFINGSAYCGMMRENDHGSFGPEFVGPGPYYVAEEADAEIERLTAQVNDAMQGEADATEAYRAQIERLRAALRQITNHSTFGHPDGLEAVKYYAQGWSAAADVAREALRGGVETTPVTSMDHGGVGQVGCEGADGLLRIHSANETCDVCSPVKTT